MPNCIKSLANERLNTELFGFMYYVILIVHKKRVVLKENRKYVLIKSITSKNNKINSNYVFYYIEPFKSFIGIISLTLKKYSIYLW